MRVLIVEDEAIIRVGMGKLIETESSHQVIGEAKNGKEGLELVLRYKPDLIITDIKMPEMDGLEMLRQLADMKIHIRTVILTGYAEFDYARQAISLGVNDYLLKPIGVQDVKEVLEKVEKMIEEDQWKQKNSETFLRDIYLGNKETYKKGYLDRIKTFYKQDKGMAYSLYLGYIGSAPATYPFEFNEKIKHLQKKEEGITCITAEIGKLQEILCLAGGNPNCLKEFSEAFYRKMIRQFIKQEQQPVWGVLHFSSLDELYTSIQELQSIISYGIALGGDQLLTKNLIKEYREEEFIQPLEIEDSVKMSICSNRTQDLKKYTNDFMNYMKSHHFSPQNIKHGYLRFLSFLMNLLQEIDVPSFEQMQSRCFMKQIGDARTLQELEATLTDITLFLETTQGKKEDIRNYIIKRAINYIREHYREGISLEGIAEKLDITPEYLSTLFCREMNINFSVFLKEFRISHAKRLLKGTDMKIYEVAESVGYHDPKYFMRVFKEVQGISPKEFRTRN